MSRKTEEGYIRALQAGEELDKMVAIYVFGEKWNRSRSNKYSQDEISVWMIKTKMAQRGWKFSEMPAYTSWGNEQPKLTLKDIIFYKKDVIVHVEVEPPDGGVAEATCKSALLATIHDLREQYTDVLIKQIEDASEAASEHNYDAFAKFLKWYEDYTSSGKFAIAIDYFTDEEENSYMKELRGLLSKGAQLSRENRRENN